MLSNVQNIMARRDLLKALVVSELQSSVAQSKLGWIWWFLDPILMMLVYWGVVVGLFDRGAERYAPYPVFLFTALITWKHFSTAVGRSLSLLRSRERLIKGIPFPTVVLPLSIVFSGFAYFLFGFTVLLLSTLLWPCERHSGAFLPMLQIPFLMIFQLAVTAGAAMALSCFGVLFEDLRLFSTHALRVGFYLSPGLFGIDLVSERLRASLAPPWGDAVFAIYMANPFAVLITGYRDSILYGQFIPMHWWGILFVESVILLWGGYRIYQYYDRRVIKFL
jgi:ABC-type polysaccharide/polyol phosphate export permease